MITERENVTNMGVTPKATCRSKHCKCKSSYNVTFNFDQAIH